MIKRIFILLPAFLLGTCLVAQTILGVDVSSYEGTINWVSVKSAGYTFAFAKATEGVGLTDAYFVGNEVNGTAAGMIMGAYHFAHPENNTATAEANYFLSIAGPYIKACHLPPVLDLEDPPTGPSLSAFFTSAQLTSWVQLWMSTVQSATGIAPIIYIGPSNAAYVNSSLNTIGLWIDDYNSSPTTPPPNIGVWKSWDFKQYSWTGTVPGISGSNAIDMDVFNGSMNQFNTLAGCNAVLADFTSNVRSTCPGSSVSFTDKSTTTGIITGWKWTFSGGNPDTSTMQNPVVQYSSPGIYSVKEVVTSSSAGKDSLTYVSCINIAASASLPLVESFQSSVFPPPGWYSNLPKSTDSIWELCTTTGYSSTQCMYFPANCGQTVNITGERQEIFTPNFNFVNATKSEMWFDVAYEPSTVPTYSDTLEIYSSVDCGATWKSIYSKGGMTLCTTGSSTGAGTDTAGSHGKGCFVPPSLKAWRTDSINLTALNGQPNVMFSFENRSGWGNIIYLDNINITGNKSTGIENITGMAEVKVYPNPNTGSFFISFSDKFQERVYLMLYDVWGRQVYYTAVNSAVTQLNPEVKAGVYFYRVLTDKGDQFISDGKIIIQQ